MKDAAHHLKYTQKKVIQSVRKANNQEALMSSGVPKIQPAAKDFQEKGNFFK